MSRAGTKSRFTDALCQDPDHLQSALTWGSSHTNLRRAGSLAPSIISTGSCAPIRAEGAQQRTRLTPARRCVLPCQQQTGGHQRASRRGQATPGCCCCWLCCVRMMGARPSGSQAEALPLLALVRVHARDRGQVRRHEHACTVCPAERVTPPPLSHAVLRGHQSV